MTGRWRFVSKNVVRGLEGSGLFFAMTGKGVFLLMMEFFKNRRGFQSITAKEMDCRTRARSSQ
jgi:hypothetical protein